MPAPGTGREGVHAIMKWLGMVRKFLAEISGEADYRRYCAHLRARHPEMRPPTQAEFFLNRLEDKYSRPNRCC